MKKEDVLDFGLGRVSHNELELEKEASDQFLSDDLLQVEYAASDLVVDVGWHKPSGEYIIMLVKACDWEHPVCERRVQSVKEVRRELQALLTRANEQEVRARKDQQDR
jgi:hypothetical protein